MEEKGRFELRGYLAQEDEDSFLICFRLSGEDVESPDRIIDKSSIISAIDAAGLEGVKAYGGFERTFCIKVSKGADYDSVIREVVRIASEEIKRQIETQRNMERKLLETSLEKYKAVI